MKHLIDILDLSVEEVERLLELAGRIQDAPADYAERCRRKKLATLFFEPSTRTRLSFEAAMYELGG
ncbi:MAG: aspartate carbamoyltransferase, partial [Oscillospiraceae bacterium]|nr:aspartate carbamoyltransferase [Oscillospiraceae bacterium]